MYTMLRPILLLPVLTFCCSSAFVGRAGSHLCKHALTFQSASLRARPRLPDAEEDLNHFVETDVDGLFAINNSHQTACALVPLAALVLAPDSACADGGQSTAAVVPSALVAYGHYLSILICMGLLTYERTTVKAGMDAETEKSLVIADAAYGVTAAFVAVSGYFRVVEYGKGWEFYSHEPLFWFKLVNAGVLAGLSLFPTITLITRGSKLFKNEPIEPMSEKLAARFQKVVNAELTAILSIPLLASLMARGISYNNNFPWQAGAALTVLAILGSGAVYGKQALTWTEDEPQDESSLNEP